MNVGYLGIIQTNAPITPAYDHTYFYIPKTKTNGGYDFKSTQLFDSAPVSPVYFDSTHVDNINNPPNREIIFKKRNVDSNYDIGFAFGYGPYGSTSAENRNCFTTGNPCWTVYTSQKTYPQMVGNNGVINNVTYDAYAYRQWIDPKQYDIGKTAYWNNQNNRDLVYMDFHRSANNDVTTLPSKFIGKAVKIIESENINTPASIIPSDGNLMLSTTSDNNYNGNTYGFIVLELTDAQSGITSSIPEGVYHQTQQVSLSAAGSDYIRYSATGSLSSCSDGTLYSGPIDILSSQTIYARACNSFGNFSNSSFSYVISIPVHSGGHPPMQMINPINVIKMDSSNGASQIIPEKNIEIVHNTPEIQNIKKDLKVGSKNNDVKTLQQFLIDQNKGSKAKALKKNGVTNYFGNGTKQALIEWQKANKISATGVLDSKTKNKIKKILK